jgi:hypothetical protein
VPPPPTAPPRPAVPPKPTAPPAAGAGRTEATAPGVDPGKAGTSTAQLEATPGATAPAKAAAPAPPGSGATKARQPSAANGPATAGSTAPPGARNAATPAKAAPPEAGSARGDGDAGEPPATKPPAPPPAKPSVPPRPAGPPGPAAPTATATATTDESQPTLLLRAVTVPRRARHQPHLATRLVAPVVCLVLGAGLLSGAAAGAWLTGDSGDPSSAEAVYEDGRSLWRDVPVDQLFPAELAGEGAGPGGADRRWLRVGVAPDGGCDQVFDPLLAEVLSGVGCHRLVRATYVDETETSVTTVGLLFTQASESLMAQIKERFRDEGLAERPDLMPRAYAPPGTVAETFGDEQRHTWTVRVLTELPLVVYAVTGFADGRTATDTQPAAEATAEGEETTVALAGLGHDAEGIADRVESGLRQAAEEAQERDESDGIDLGEPR